nr:putative ribonuclease H-like domain-containing protein [Tanacetum cinerariifolium]
MKTKDTLSPCLYLDEQDMQQMLKRAKILKGSCLNGLSAIKSNFTRKLEQGITKSEFERAFSHIFGEDVDTFTRTFSQNMDTLEQQLTKEYVLESNCHNAFRVLKTQFEKIFTSVLIKPSSLDATYARKDFHTYTSIEPQLFKETILKNFDFIEDYMLKTIIHAQTIQKRLDDKKDTSRRSRNDVDADDVDIRPIYDEELMDEVQMTAKINVFAIGQQHTEQPKFNNKGEIDQNAKQCHDTCPLPIKIKISKPRIASKVDVNNDLPKSATIHYLPKEIESSFAKPHHVIASSNSRNSSKNMLRFSSNDMVHNHYLEEAKNKTQDKGRNSKPSKCVFNANHDSRVTKFLKEVNLCAKVPSNKTTNRNKPVEQTSFIKKPKRQISKRHRFSIKKTSVVNEKTMTPRSCLSSELRIHDHNNEPSSSKLVPKVVPLVDMTATSRQELELLFHHHITMLRLQLRPERQRRVNSTERVNTVGSKAVSAVKGNKVTVVKTSAGYVWRPRVNDIDQISKYNRALVTKSHNKTPYELLNGRTPRLDFMRPFGCSFAILNTLDPLGKFKGTQNNVNAGKEVFDQHYIALPLWSSISSTFKSSDDKAVDDKQKDDIGSKTVEEPVNKKDQAYRDELDRLTSQEKEASDKANALRKEFELGCMDQRGATKAGSINSFNTVRCMDQRGATKAGSINSFNTVSNPVNASSTLGNFSAGGPSSPHLNAFIPANTLLHVDQDDSQIPYLEDTAKLRSTGIFTGAYDDDLDIFTSPVQSVGAEADYNNMDFSTIVSPIPTHRVTPNLSHVHAVKRIFRYLKGQPKLGLWYPKDSSFDLEAYSDSDYAGANLDRKFITRGCQFLGRRLISWQCKNQTIVATSTTEAEMLEVIDRQDVLHLHKIIIKRFPDNDPEGYDLILWGDLKTLVKSSKDDEI